MPDPLTADSHPAHLEQLTLATAASRGFAVLGVQVFSHRIPMTVQVLVQRADGGDISLDECASLSAPLGEAIEAAGLLPEAYVLEISSPGVCDELHDDRDFRSFRGFPVEAECLDPKGKTLRRGGLLLERDAEALHLNVRGRIQRIPRNTVISVRLVTPTAE